MNKFVRIFKLHCLGIPTPYSQAFETMFKFFRNLEIRQYVIDHKYILIAVDKNKNIRFFNHDCGGRLDKVYFVDCIDEILENFTKIENTFLPRNYISEEYLMLIEVVMDYLKIEMNTGNIWNGSIAEDNEFLEKIRDAMTKHH